MKRSPLLRLLPLLLVLALCVGLLHVGFQVWTYSPDIQHGWFAAAYGQTQEIPALAEDGVDGAAAGSENPLAAPNTGGTETAAEYSPPLVNFDRADGDADEFKLDAGTAEVDVAPRQVLMQVKLMEIDHRVLREKHFDLAKEIRGEKDADNEGGAGPLPPPATAVVAVLEPRELRLLETSLKLAGAGKVVAEPTLVTITGRKATVHAGGEIPLLVIEQTLNGKRQDTIDSRRFGTSLEVTPTLIGKDRLRLVVDGEYSRKLPDRAQLPRILVRKLQTTAELKPGQALVMAETRAAIGQTIHDGNGATPAGSSDPYGVLAPDETTQTSQGLLLILIPKLVDATDVGVIDAGGTGLNATAAAGQPHPVPEPARSRAGGPVTPPNTPASPRIARSNTAPLFDDGAAAVPGGVPSNRAAPPQFAESGPEPLFDDESTAVAGGVPSNRPAPPQFAGSDTETLAVAPGKRLVHLKLDPAEARTGVYVRGGDRVNVIAIRRLGEDPGTRAEFENVLEDVMVRTATIGPDGRTIAVAFELPPKAAERLEMAKANCVLDVARLPMADVPGKYVARPMPQNTPRGPAAVTPSGPVPRPAMPGAIETFGPAARPAPLREELQSLREEVRGLRRDIDRVIELLEKRQGKADAGGAGAEDSGIDPGFGSEDSGFDPGFGSEDSGFAPGGEIDGGAEGGFEEGGLVPGSGAEGGFDAGDFDTGAGAEGGGIGAAFDANEDSGLGEPSSVPFPGEALPPR